MYDPSYARLFGKKIKFDPLSTNKLIILPLVLFLLTITVFIVFISMPEYVVCEGVIEPVEYIPVISEVNGRISASKMIEGQVVDTGDTLIQLDTTEIDLQIMSIENEIQSTSQNLDFLLEMHELRNIEFSANLHKMNIDRERVRKLIQANGVPLTELETIELTITNLQNNYNIIVAESSHSIDLARTQLESLNLQKQQLEVELEKYCIVAQSPGKVLLSNNFFIQDENVNYLTPRPSVSQYISARSIIGYIIRNNQFAAKIRIPQSKMDKVEVGQIAKIYFVPYDYTKYKFLEAELNSISTSATGGDFIGYVNIPTEFNEVIVRNKKIELNKIIGTNLTVRIQVEKDNIITKILNF